jgi:hypothetical protein
VLTEGSTQRGPDLETEAAWQAHYIKWAKIFGIPDPCGYYKGFIRIVAIYIKFHFPDEGVQHTLQFKTNNDNGILVSINIFEFVMVIINYCAAFHVVRTSLATNNPHPVILNISNNSSALS